MLFIAGTKGVTSTHATGEFYCPHCESNRNYKHQMVHQKATIFFIPVVNLKLLGEYIECQECFNTYKIEVLDINTEENDDEFMQSMYFLGIKRVMTMMMLADGRIDDEEKATIKDIMHKLTKEELSDIELQEEIDFCTDDPSNMETYIKTLFPHLNEQGREMVYKAGYYISIADGDLDDREEKLLQKIAKILQLSTAHCKGIIAEIHGNEA